jgi:hypothetical protein
MYKRLRIYSAVGSLHEPLANACKTFTLNRPLFPLGHYVQETKAIHSVVKNLMSLLRMFVRLPL